MQIVLLIILLIAQHIHTHTKDEMHKLIKLIEDETIKLSHNIKDMRTVRELKLYEIVHGMLIHNIKKTKREIFYTSPNVFKKQDMVNRMIGRFAARHGIKLADLNVSASLKGLFYGDITFVENNKTYILTKNLIPDMNEIIEIKHTFSKVLVVEKDSMLTFIKEVFLKNSRQIDFLLVTGKGYPDHNTIEFLQRLQNMQCTIYGLFDLDPFGLSIYRNYKSQIQCMIRIGISSQDVFEFKVHRNELITLSSRDDRLLCKLMDQKIDNMFADDALFLKGLGRKMEIEIFTSYESTFIMDYLFEKM